jgi:hypothetical protein
MSGRDVEKAASDLFTVLVISRMTPVRKELTGTFPHT